MKQPIPPQSHAAYQRRLTPNPTAIRTQATSFVDRVMQKPMIETDGCSFESLDGFFDTIGSAVLGGTEYGGKVVWYSDIEDGFNVSRWTRHGLIDDYFCDQCELTYVLANLVNHLVEVAASPPKRGPPRNVVLDPDCK